jgi:uncharacterized protein (TIGR02231 family)
MKTLMLYWLLSSNAYNMAIQSNASIELDNTKIKKVTVFLNGAQLLREGNFTVQSGVSEIVFNGVSPYVDANSLQARGVGEFTILDVKYNVFYPQPDPVVNDPQQIPNDVLKKIRLLTDSIEVQQSKLNEVYTKMEIRNMEKTMLMNNGTVKGIGKVNDSIALLKDAMEYFHTKMTEINLDLYNMKKEETSMNKKLTGMSGRLNALNNWSYNNNLKTQIVKGPVYQIVVSVSAEKMAIGKIEVSYLVSQCGWTPSYDLKAKDLNAPVELSYKASVYQNTGEEWKDVNLTLSSSNPYLQQTKPILSTWYISYYDPNYYNQRSQGYYDDYYNESKKGKADAAAYGGVPAMQEKLSASPNGVAATAEQFTVKIQNMVSAEFEIKLAYTIKSNNEPHLVSIAKETLKAEYILALVPKMDKNAFLVANITDWEDLNLLPARANIYYDGTYVGQSYLDPMSMEDTLRLAMGRDNNITAIRKKQKDKEKEKVLGENKVKSLAYEINIKNTHGYNVDMIIEDQIPVSNVDDIKVEMIDKGKAGLNELTGFLTWKTKLKAGASEKLTYEYQVKYDKDKQLSFANW